MGILSTIKGFFIISEGQSRLTDFRVPVVTGCITLYFAGRSYYLDRKIRKLSNFNGRCSVNVMHTFSQLGFTGKVVRFMFTNYSNVRGFIDGIYVKTLPVSKRERIKNYFNDGTIYKCLVSPYRDKNCILGSQGLPMELGGNESKEIYVDFNAHINCLNEALLEGNMLFRGYFFVDSLGNKYEFIPKKDSLKELIKTERQLNKFKNRFS